MTTYHYKCDEGHSFDRDVKMDDRNKQKCRCGAKSAVAFWEVSNKVGYRPFPEGLWEHLGPTPVYIESKKQLVEECKKRGKISPFYM